MKNLMVIVTVLACFLCCIEGNPSQKGKNGHSMDSLLVRNSHLDIGKVSKSDGDYVNFTFELKNCGANVVVVNNIDVSCNCISLTKPTRPIRPNEWSKIVGRINITNQKGHLSKSMFVSYGNGKLLLLRVMAEIQD